MPRSKTQSSDGWGGHPWFDRKLKKKEYIKLPVILDFGQLLDCKVRSSSAFLGDYLPTSRLSLGSAGSLIDGDDSISSNWILKGPKGSGKSKFILITQFKSRAQILGILSKRQVAAFTPMVLSCPRLECFRISQLLAHKYWSWLCSLQARWPGTGEQLLGKGLHSLIQVDQPNSVKVALNWKHSVIFTNCFPEKTVGLMPLPSTLIPDSEMELPAEMIASRKTEKKPGLSC